jgi:ankyrin repeat protein/V8-like Glu-specific endopeptidase
MAKNLAGSTFAMIDRGIIKGYGYDKIAIVGRETKFCPGEPFAGSMLAPTCSGFLVGPDLLVTAGHCVKHADSCAKKKWVLDFREDLRSANNTVILDQDKVFHCKEILLQKFSGVDYEDDDFAIIRLDRRVDRVPLKFRTERKIPDWSETAIIGHPIGLPQIITPFARIVRNQNIKRFYIDGDAFGGNSGGAVIDMDRGIVEGILVTNIRGKDFVVDKENKCLRMGHLTEIGGPPPAGVYRITEISDYLTTLLGSPLINYTWYPENFWARLFGEDENNLKKLILEGLDVNTIDDHEESLLHWAVKNEKLSAIKFLIKNYVNLDHKDHFKETPLFYAARIGNFEIAKILIQNGARINTRNRELATVFHVAVGVENLPLIKYLIKKRIDINALDADNNTPLIYASSYGKLESVTVLLNSDVRVNQANKNRVTPFIAAASKGHMEILRLLLPHVWNVNEQDDDGSTALIFASAKGHIDIVRTLLRRREIEINKANFHGQTPLFWAHKNGHTEVVRLLQLAGARD